MSGDNDDDDGIEKLAPLWFDRPSLIQDAASLVRVSSLIMKTNRQYYRGKIGCLNGYTLMWQVSVFMGVTSAFRLGQVYFSISRR